MIVFSGFAVICDHFVLTLSHFVLTKWIVHTQPSVNSYSIYIFPKNVLQIFPFSVTIVRRGVRVDRRCIRTSVNVQTSKYFDVFAIRKSTSIFVILSKKIS